MCKCRLSHLVNGHSLLIPPSIDDQSNRPLSSDEWLARIGGLKIQGLTYNQLVQRLAFKHSDGLLKKRCNHDQVITDSDLNSKGGGFKWVTWGRMDQTLTIQL